MLTGQDQPLQQKTSARSGLEVPRDKYVESSSNAVSSQKSYIMSSEGELFADHQFSPPVPSIKHRLDSGRSDCVSRRTARTQGFVHSHHRLENRDFDSCQGNVRDFTKSQGIGCAWISSRRQSLAGELSLSCSRPVADG